MIYFISDNHWGHKAVIWMSQRNFEDVHQMNMHMIEKWNEVVGEDDEVYYLGDFMYKMNPNQFVRNVLNNLNGKIYLLIGNHDERHLHKYMERLEWAKDRFELKYIHDDEKMYKFILDHYPIYSWKGMWRKTIHIHGHTHWNKEDAYFQSKGHKINVNCEFLDYKPISIVEIINKFNNNELTTN
jgi:calcineurin-like phosphoesterase family protein